MSSCSLKSGLGGAGRRGGWRLFGEEQLLCKVGQRLSDHERTSGGPSAHRRLDRCDARPREGGLSVAVQIGRVVAEESHWVVGYLVVSV